jgi:hypothetical protein
MSLVTIGVIIAALLVVKTPAHRKAQLLAEEKGKPGDD